MEKICMLAISHLSTNRSILLHAAGPSSPKQLILVELAALVPATASAW